MVLGIDVGGTGLKAALVDTSKGKLISERKKYLTPQPATPETVKPFVKKFISDFDYKGDIIGVGFPAIIKNEICCSATNLDDSWIGKNLFQYFDDATSKKCTVVNDADAAGIGEWHFGNLKNKNGTSILLTLGTGIGSAVFSNGELVPNTELGHLKWKNGKAEDFASNRARKKEDLDWSEWGKRLNGYLEHLDFVFSPDIFVIGGGVSKKFKSFESYFNKDLKVIPATLLNEAGIIGAAMAAKK